MQEIQDLIAKLVEFRDARDWGQFHTLKNLVAALSVESAELLELAQWKTAEELEISIFDIDFKARFEREIADILIYLLLVCDRAKIDPIMAAKRKIDENEAKYPIEKSHGNAVKYSDFAIDR